MVLVSSDDRFHSIRRLESNEAETSWLAANAVLHENDVQNLPVLFEILAEFGFRKVRKTSNENLCRCKVCAIIELPTPSLKRRSAGGTLALNLLVIDDMSRSHNGIQGSLRSEGDESKSTGSSCSGIEHDDAIGHLTEGLEVNLQLFCGKVLRKTTNKNFKGIIVNVRHID